MRLNGIQTRIIRETLADVFGSEMRLILFGSRVDDNARGGDIDLLVEAPLAEDELFRRKIAALTKLSTRLGEQKIDLVTTSGSSFDTRAIVQAALAEGVPL
jgi:predicted nucleotidyltransferase